MRITRTVAGRRRRAALVATTGLTATALLLTGCSDSDSSDAGGSSDANGKITLTVADFGQFGYKEAGLFAKYHELHPNITVKEDVTADEKVYYPKLLQQLNSGSGLADVQGLEVGRIKELVDTKADQFADLSKVINVGDWVSWKEKQATTPDGKVIGAGTDIGPMSLCYNADLFKKAGLPTDRKEVAAKVAGGWEDYLKLGEEYKKNAPEGTFFMDSASAMYNAVVSSNPKQYYDESGKPVYKESPSVKQGWDLAAEAADKKLSQGLAQFSPRGMPHCARARWPPWSAPRGWPVRSRSTPVTATRASGTSPPRRGPPPPTGVARSSVCPSRASTSTRPPSSSSG